jgi:hypothetical protein
MKERTPESFWDRVMRTLDGWMDEEGGVDESTLSFHLVFVVPIFLVLVMLLRR